MNAPEYIRRFYHSYHAYQAYLVMKKLSEKEAGIVCLGLGYSKSKNQYHIHSVPKETYLS